MKLGLIKYWISEDPTLRKFQDKLQKLKTDFFTLHKIFFCWITILPGKYANLLVFTINKFQKNCLSIKRMSFWCMIKTKSALTIEELLRNHLGGDSKKHNSCERVKPSIKRKSFWSLTNAKSERTTEEQLSKYLGGDSRNKTRINRMSLWSIQTVNEKEVILTLDKCHDNSQKCAHNRRTTYKASYKCTYLINVRRHTKIHDKRLSSNVKRRYQCDQKFILHHIWYFPGWFASWNAPKRCVVLWKISVIFWLWKLIHNLPLSWSVLY